MDFLSLLFFVFALMAEIVGTVAGFGSSTILLPLSLFFVDFRTGLVLVAIFHISGNFGRSTFFRYGLDKKMILTFGVPSIILSIVGAQLVGTVSQPLLKIILGVFLIVVSVALLVKPKLQFPTNTRTVVAGGGISGFITGLVGTGGAIRAAFLTGFNVDKFKYIATAAIIAIGTDATRIPVYLSQGFLTSDYYYFVPILIAIALVGSFIGRRIVKKIDQDKFKKMVLIGIILVSITFIVNGIRP
jgi:uncharacterized membrane protein YfcA